MRAFVALMIIGAGTTIVVDPIVVSQRTDAFVESRDHPLIAYNVSHLPDDPVADLNVALERGDARLRPTPGSGYLEATLEALKISIASQLLVFSETSAQAKLIKPSNPRAVYFNDTVAVGWGRGRISSSSRHRIHARVWRSMSSVSGPSRSPDLGERTAVSSAT